MRQGRSGLRILEIKFQFTKLVLFGACVIGVGFIVQQARADERHGGSDTSAQSQVPRSPRQGAVVQVDRLLSQALHVLPESRLQCATSRIQDVLHLEGYGQGDAEVGAQNSGIVAHLNTVLESNGCLAGIAGRFWDSLVREEENLSASRALRPRASLADTAGAGGFADRQPGWLWRRAMQATGQSPNAAMAILAVCGHDDVGLAFSSRSMDHDSVVRELRSEALELTDLRRELAERLRGLESGTDEFRLIQFQLTRSNNRSSAIASAIMNSQVVEIPHTCPAQNSEIFAQEALGRDVDISESLKDRIAQVQHGGNRSRIPAKGYHFIGSAYMGCQLSQCGVSPETASQISSLLGSAYRSIRICGSVSQALTDRIANSQGIDPDTNFAELRSRLVAAARRQVGSPATYYIATHSGEQIRLDFGSGTFDASRLPWPSEAEVVALAGRMADRQLREGDAAVLFARWYLHTSGSNSSVPSLCSAIRLGGPVDLREPDPQSTAPRRGSLGRVSRAENICRVPGWSAERCENARRVLATWDVDFEWTASQHRVGALFGARQCRPQAEANQYDARICPNGHPPDGPSASGTPGALPNGGSQ